MSFEKFSPIRLQKFPVPVPRGFACKPLNSLAASRQNVATGPNLQDSLSNSQLAGNVDAETSSQWTASSATSSTSGRHQHGRKG